MTTFDQTIRQLQMEFVSFKTQWVAMRHMWRDSVGDRFERESWDPVEKEVRAYMEALERLAREQEQADIHSR